MRILIAGVLGGIAMFIWASIAHVATPLARAGLQPLPGGGEAVAALHLGGQKGLYIFPSEMSAANAQPQPSVLLAYQAPGAGDMTASRLGIEFALEVIESLLTAVILIGAASFGARMGLALAVGVVAAIATNFSYWNWYGFSDAYTLANAFTELVKFVVAGAVIAWFLGRRAKAA